MIDIQSAAAEIRRGKKKELECGPMPNLMVALPNIGGALCSTPQSLADAHYLAIFGDFLRPAFSASRV